MRVLCLGNNTKDTDNKTHQLALANNHVCHGLISELEYPIVKDLIVQNGYYHSSVYDITFSRLIMLARKFDRIVILDQPKSCYSHPDSFYKTIRVAKEIAKTQMVIYVDPAYEHSITFFQDFVNTNKSFCIFPFIELLSDNGNTTVCCRSTTPVTPVKNLDNFRTDIQYQEIRTKMLNGEQLPDHCSSCYNLEKQGIVSARMQETVEWCNRLDLNSLEDLEKLTEPAYYEVRPSNVCNLQCRMCGPESSNLIAREYKKLNLISNVPNKEFADFDIIKFDQLKKLYVAGGEPTAMIELYNFLDRCIDNKQTDFEFVINTNATKFNSRFRQQIKHFSNFQFIISIDGFKELNHYIRWPSDWATIVDNVRYLKQHNHVVSFNVTVSIYNIATLVHLLKFFDTEFPKTLVHCQLAGTKDDILSALNYPYRDQVLNNLTQVQQLNCYKDDPLLSSFVDGIIGYYQARKSVDLDKLKKFFKFNELLDQSRNIQLKDYLPELAQYKELL
jgi:sulfatase maturation enzyme AslB (radical SAM superfamily)